MRVYFTKNFPFGKFIAISLFGRIYYKDRTGNRRGYMVLRPERYMPMVEHERTHWMQQKETLIIPFFIIYIIDWVVKLFTEKGKAYRNVCFEREAYANEDSHDNYDVVEHEKYLDFIPKKENGYLVNRKWFAWVRYIFHTNPPKK